VVRLKFKQTDMNQNKRLLTYLEQGKKVNPLEAWNNLGIYRLASRVCDLRKEGIEVKDEWLDVSNRFGEFVKVKQYYL
jgi:hypothetical protein